MFSGEAFAAANIEALRSTSWAVGANNGPFIDVSQYEGDLKFVFNCGAITGSVIFKLQDATDSGGTGVADLSPAVASASITAAGTTQALIVDKRKIRSHVRFVATVTTGPVLAAAVLQSRQKTA